MLIYFLIAKLSDVFGVQFYSVHFDLLHWPVESKDLCKTAQMMIRIYEYWGFMNTYIYNQYFPCVYRMPVLSLSGHCVHVQAQYVVCGPVPGEDCHRHVLPGGHSLPVLLLALSHSLLPLGGGVPRLLKVSTCNTHCIYLYWKSGMAICNLNVQGFQILLAV